MSRRVHVWQNAMKCGKMRACSSNCVNITKSGRNYQDPTLGGMALYLQGRGGGVFVLNFSKFLAFVRLCEASQASIGLVVRIY
jgi:hypothetical protein